MKLFFYTTVFSVLFLALLCASGLFLYHSPGPLKTDKTVVIEKGSGFLNISKTLQNNGIVSSQYLVSIPAFLSGQKSQFKPGEYAFSAGISPQEAIEALANGDVVVHKATIPEGLTSKQIVAMISNIPTLSGEITNVPSEGSLLPETYHFSRGDSRQSIIARMQADMKKTSEALWQNRANDLPFNTLEDAITLASIVEKEARVAAERPHIASVYINRLHKGMKLQADPTTIYAIELEMGKPMERLLYTKDLKRDLPHNTYMNEGLPPTPIANPGKASIAATLNPKTTDDIFFVARGDGGHYFAKTYKEHQQNIIKYKAAQRAN